MSELEKDPESEEIVADHGSEPELAADIDADDSSRVKTSDLIKQISAAAGGTVGDVEYSKVVAHNFLIYSVSTLLDRALPQIDGLLPAQRRVILSLHDSGLHSKARYRKSAYVVGYALGAYHPHGDQSIYGSLARLAQDFSLRVPLVDGQGSFGSIDGDNPAAMRYTECRMTLAAEELVADLDEEVLVDYSGRNFDESRWEPELLPVRFPNLLINGSFAIATGMQANFLPHNPAEALDLCLWRLDHPEASVKEVAKRISGPDFPAGGIVIRDDNLRAVYETGKGRVTGIAKAHAEPAERGRHKIIITELPWMVRKGGDGGVIDKISKQFRDKGFYPEFESLNDFSDDTKGMNIEIVLKRGADPQAALLKLMKNGVLRNTYPVEMNVVHRGQPKTVNLTEMIDYFLDLRKNIVLRRAEKRLRVIAGRLYRLDAYIKVIGATDAVVKIIKKSKDRQSAKPGLIKLLKIDDEQAQMIVEMQLGSLTQLDSHKIEEEVKELVEEQGHLEKFVKSPKMIIDLIADEFREVKAEWKKQGGILERRTELTSPSDDAELDLVDQLESASAEDCFLLVSASGKAICAAGTARRGGSLKISADDRVVVAEPAKTNEEWLIVTDEYQGYRLRLSEIPLEGRRVSGDQLSSLIGIGPDERVIAAIPLRRELDGKLVDVSDTGDVLFVTAAGMVKRTGLSEFARANSAGIVAGKLHDGDKLLVAKLNSGYEEALIVADNGKALRFSLDDVRVMGRSAAGVKGINLKGGAVIAADLIPKLGARVIVIQESGLAKQVDLIEISVKGRGGQGVTVAKVDSKYGAPVLAIVAGQDVENLLVEQAATPGKLAPIPLKQIAPGKPAMVPKSWAGEEARGLFIDWAAE